ncbi:MAG TPA: hypothetical protein VHF69_08805 [Candidatus Synoicihabitans sp.]|nr:hypothetical protein [Candidatus Synoicihabitans sp.]
MTTIPLFVDRFGLPRSPARKLQLILGIALASMTTSHGGAREPVGGVTAPSTSMTNEPSTRSAAGPSRKLGLDDYRFIAPDQWQAQRRPDHLLLTQTADLTGCVIQILPPQPSSGDLQKDVSAVFDLMYAGWQPQRAGVEKFTLSKGILPKGLEFCLLEAGMAQTTADGRYHTEDGAALVIRAGDHIGIVAARHRGLLAHGDCIRKYTTWRRFFNSLAIDRVPLAPNRESGLPERIIGRWSMGEGGASGEYLFAANGHYAFVGALGSSTVTTDFNYRYLHIKSYAFEGDGTYALVGADLVLSKHGTRDVERRRLRFEQVNHGGAGWKDRVWMLTRDRAGEIEVCYQKQDR